ncbi:phospholipase C/P1 nuclease [Clavulina sp. PMI_390]|nr:phospholipase C/P1 nuclease [Clavulina sp. PMI_390]
MRFQAASALLLGAAVAPAVQAWGVAGHEIVATIAQIFLTPTARHTLCGILPASAKCHLAPIAAWADRVRNPYTGPLHYVNGLDDWPADHCSFGEHGWTDDERNVLVGIWNSTRNVAYLDGNERDFALRYLVHFMGDLHMPLHLIGRDRGGNKVPVRFDHRITNLHSVWDGLLIAQSIRTLTNYTEPLPSKTIESALRGAIYDSYIRFIVWEGILGWWKDDYTNWANCPAVEDRSPVSIRSMEPPSMLESPLSFDEEDIHHHDDHEEEGDSFLLSMMELEGSQQHPLEGLQAPRRRPSSPPPPPLSSLPVCPYEWAKPIHELNCNSTLIWPRFFSEMPPNTPIEHIPAKDLIQLDTPEYAGRVRKELVIERMMAMAGVRLAAVLNELLDPVDDDASAGFGKRSGAGVRVWNA